MSLDYAPPKKFPHKLALIDVQFLENVSTRYLWHVLFVWRLSMWKKKFFKCCFLCLHNGESAALRFWQTPGSISSRRASGRADPGWAWMHPRRPSASTSRRPAGTVQPRHAGAFLQLQWNALCPKQSTSAEARPSLPRALGAEKNLSHAHIANIECDHQLCTCIQVRMCRLCFYKYLSRPEKRARFHKHRVKVLIYFFSSGGKTWCKIVSRNVPKIWEVFSSC